MPHAKSHDFSGYRQFTANLRRMADEPSWTAERLQEVTASLDGVAGKELRKLVELPARRAFGAFFTGSELADKLLGTLRLGSKQHFIYDPTVGAGDLLLAGARRLPCETSLAATLAAWGQCLAGTDLHPEFVEAAQLRVALLARQRHGGQDTLPAGWRKLLPHIKHGDGLKQKALFARATHLLMNPPYCLTESDADCTWSGGRISEAALFVMRGLEMAPANARLFAILPDVLRSGSFQHHWRERVSDLATVESVERHGIFDDAADVDVFLLKLRRRTVARMQSKRWPASDTPAGTSVADFFDVHVGRVVPHRDAEEGPLRRYIHPRNIPVWQEVTRIADKRRHKLAYQPPFVVLRRTSRPGHPYRAAATVILGKAPVAVENHLIVCEPRDQSADTCHALMAQLHTQRVNEFLDQRIRCRHLTVGAVAAIPFSL
jgi:hypothetical protein